MVMNVNVVRIGRKVVNNPTMKITIVGRINRITSPTFVIFVICGLMGIFGNGCLG